MKAVKYERAFADMKTYGLDKAKCCQICSHLMFIRKHGIYAACKMTGYTFMACQIDTRTVACPLWEEMDE